MRLVPVVVVLLAVAGCGGSAGSADSLRGKVFVSTSVSDRRLVEGTSVELRFTDDGRLVARAGCNLMQGPVDLGGGKLEVADLSSTAMGCPKPELHEQDEWLSKLLGATPDWRLQDENLVVTGAGGEIVLAPEAPARLEGGEWRVDTLVSADAASSVPGAVPATLKFENGRVEVFTGCNSGSASYRVDGRAITFEGLVHTDKACGPDEALVEKAVVGALQGEVNYEVERSSLSLTNTQGDGIQLKK
ncbi:META domain-containing protein [Lentzea chajnantorensis]